jgi:hypothetical protein
VLVLESVDVVKSSKGQRIYTVKSKRSQGLLCAITAIPACVRLCLRISIRTSLIANSFHFRFDLVHPAPGCLSCHRALRAFATRSPAAGVHTSRLRLERRITPASDVVAWPCREWMDDKPRCCTEYASGF